MTAATIANALQRVRSVLARRPEAAMHADEPAIARWEQGMRVVSRHANGTHIATNMPSELGGEGNQVTPGWLLRAALASCLATRIAMEAAARGIVITRLEVIAESRSGFSAWPTPLVNRSCQHRATCSCGFVSLR